MKLHIQNLKLLRDFSLEFCNPDGTPRMWTVIIGENGTCKTSILQAIAMAAAGGRQINGLVDRHLASLRDKRNESSVLKLYAEFLLSKEHCHHRNYPSFSSEKESSGSKRRPTGHQLFFSEVSLEPKRDLVAHSTYEKGKVNTGDPLAEVRAADDSLWFVAAYGVGRFLPGDTVLRECPKPASIYRLKPIFQSVELVSTTWADFLTPDQLNNLTKLLQRLLRDTEPKLIPGISDLELRGRYGIHDRDALSDSPRFEQVFLNKTKVKLPASWLAHGYQSTLAWLVDLIGHIVYEAKDVLNPSEMEGLVLIDEIDLYLHPAWQRTLVSSLKRTFPKLQFVATTHSPLTLVGLRPDEDEIVRLKMAENGDIQVCDMKQGREHEPDARLMTGTEIYRTYFGIDKLYPGDAGNLLREHRYLAADPGRSAEEDQKLDAIEAKLKREGVMPDFERVPRSDA